MISWRCLNPLCARPWADTPGFVKRMPPSERDRCPFCGHRSIAETVRRPA